MEHSFARKPDVTIADLGRPMLDVTDLRTPTFAKCSALRRPLIGLVLKIAGIGGAITMNSWPQRMFVR